MKAEAEAAERLAEEQPACVEIVAVVGETGSGKSTLGRLSLRLERPSKGHVHFEGVDVTGASQRKIFPYHAVQETLPNGVLAGFPVVDVKVTLFDGSYHEVDSNENAFKMAGLMAFKEGLRRASPPGQAHAQQGGGQNALHPMRHRARLVSTANLLGWSGPVGIADNEEFHGTGGFRAAAAHP